MAFKVVTLNGKRVNLWAERFPAGRFHAAFTRLIGYKQSGDFAEDMAPFMPFIDSWEFDGDPQDIEAWGALDYVTELGPLMREIGAMFSAASDALAAATDDSAEKN